jgi:predicted small lipoprotein YifL
MARRFNGGPGWVLLAMVLAGCGQKGPLYLPETTGEVVTRPAQTPPPADTGNSSSSPQSVDSPATPANPAPEVTEPELESERDKQKKEGATAPPR